MPIDEEKEYAAEGAACRFYGKEEWYQPSRYSFSDEELRQIRHKNNVERPSFYGGTIHGLLTTCAVLRCEIDALRNALRGLHSACDVVMGATDPADPDNPLVAAMGRAAELFDDDADYPLEVNHG